jgi:hypothetical protein
MDYIHYCPQNTCYHLDLVNIDPQPVRILTSQLKKLEKLQENRLIAQDLIASNQWNKSLWSHNWFIELSFNLKITYYGFQGLFLNMFLNSKDNDLGHT